MEHLGHDWRFEALPGDATATSIGICNACGLARVATPGDPPDLTGVCAQRPARSRIHGYVDASADLLQRFGGLIALTASAIGLLLLAAPNLAPSTTNTVEITEVTVENGVQYAQYLSRRSIKRALVPNSAGDCQNSSFVPTAEPDGAALGVVADFAWTASGMRDHCVELTASILDGESGAVLSELPVFGWMRPDKQGADTATYLLWVNGSEMPTQAKYVIRVEFYDAARPDGVRFTYKDSPAFCFPAICPSPQASASPS